MTDDEPKGMVAETRNHVGSAEPQREDACAHAETWRRIETLAAEYREKNPGVTPEETAKRIETLAAEHRRKNPRTTPEETLKRIKAFAAARL